MSAAAATLDQADAWRPAVNPWMIAIAVTLATFMEVLDTSIANVALPHIAGGLSAGQDESDLGPDFVPGLERDRSSSERLAVSIVGRKNVFTWDASRCSPSVRSCADSRPVWRF